MTYSELANWDGSLTRREAQAQTETEIQAPPQAASDIQEMTPPASAEMNILELLRTPSSSPKELPTSSGELRPNQSVTSIQDNFAQESDFEGVVGPYVEEASQCLSLGKGLLEVRASLSFFRELLVHSSLALFYKNFVEHSTF